ncbi:secreted protein [Beggiatoa sp. PS]|nr:secreted protein [Beggiatoa sp. PS]
MERLFNMAHAKLFIVFFALCATSQSLVAVTAEELGKMLLGTNHEEITQDYNVYYSVKNGCHPGIDYRARTPLTVYSPVKGVVANTPGGTYGTVSVKIDGTNYYFIFLHLSSFSVKQGTKVDVGTKIGETGSAGAPGAPHLHVEARNGRSGSTWYFKADKYNRCTLSTGYNVNPTTVVSPSRTLSYIQILGSDSIKENSCQFYSVNAHYTDGSLANVTNKVYWGNYSWLTVSNSYGGSYAQVCASSVSSDSYTELNADYNEGDVYSDQFDITIKDSGSSSLTTSQMVEYVFDELEDNYSDYFSPHQQTFSYGNGYYRYYPNGSWLYLYQGTVWYNLYGYGWNDSKSSIQQWYDSLR